MVIYLESTTDNIVSFRLISRTLRDRKLNYAEPRLYSAHLTKNPLSVDSVDILISTQLPTKDTIPSPLVMPPSKQPRPSPSSMPPKVDSVYSSEISKIHLIDMPYIHPCNTASLSYTKQAFYSLKLHRIFGCLHFRNPKPITSADKNATVIDTGEPPTTPGAFAIIPKSNEGKSKILHLHFLEKSHMDIVYGDCTSMGGYPYGLFLFDVATQYFWFYGLKSTT